LGEIQGEFRKTTCTEYIDKMFLIFYYVLGRLQALYVVGDEKQFPQRWGNGPKMGRFH
jgi:hypothetical protein